MDNDFNEMLDVMNEAEDEYSAEVAGGMEAGALDDSLMSQEEFVASGGSCPKCKGTEVEQVGMPEVGEGYVRNPMQCMSESCGALYDEIYNLEGYANLRMPDEDNRMPDEDDMEEGYGTYEAKAKS